MYQYRQRYCKILLFWWLSLFLFFLIFCWTCLQVFIIKPRHTIFYFHSFISISEEINKWFSLTGKKTKSGSERPVKNCSFNRRASASDARLLQNLTESVYRGPPCQIHPSIGWRHQVSDTRLSPPPVLARQLGHSPLMLNIMFEE